MQKVGVDVLRHVSLAGLVIILPGGVDEGDDKVFVEEVAQAYPISLYRTDDPSEFRNSMVVPMQLQGFGGVPGEQLAMILGGNAAVGSLIMFGGFGIGFERQVCPDFNCKSVQV